MFQAHLFAVKPFGETPGRWLEDRLVSGLDGGVTKDAPDYTAPEASSLFTRYEGATLRENLGLTRPPWPARKAKADAI